MTTCSSCGANIIDTDSRSCPMCGSSIDTHEPTNNAPGSESAISDPDFEPASPPLAFEPGLGFGNSASTYGKVYDEPKDEFTPENAEDDIDLDTLDTPPMGIDLDAEVSNQIDKPSRPINAPPPSINDDQKFVSADDKEALMKKLGQVQGSSQSECDGQSTNDSKFPSKMNSDFNSQQGKAHSSDSSTDTKEEPTGLPSPKMASKGRGVANFWRNYVELSGHPGLRTKDELVVNGRDYELRPKQIDRQWVVTAAAACLTIVLVLIGAQFVGEGINGQGTIMGIVLDDQGHPYLLGAEVRLPQSGQTVMSNTQGFFVCSDVAPGAHKVEYLVDGNLVATEFTTVVNDEISTLYLSPPVQTPSESERSIAMNDSQKESGNAGSATTNRASESRSTKSSKKRWAKLTLASGVDGARLVMDGQELGFGDITYVKLLPGKHSYTVSAEGHQQTSGTIMLKADRNNTLEVALTPLEPEVKEITYTADDFYYSGTIAISEGRYEAAIDEFSKAISSKPSYTEAYERRAQAYAAISAVQLAHDDFIRAAEIHRIHGNQSRAISSYNSAIKVNDKSMTAYLGRADLYLAQKQEIAAIADYEAAKDIDKKNPRVHFGLGKARFQQANYNRAIKHFKEARSLNRSDPLVHQYLMLAYFRADKTKDVRKSYRDFVDMATPDQMAQFRSDSKFSAVLRIVDND